MPIKDITGQKFGKLTVVELIPTSKRGAYWRCICDCGNETIVKANHLRSGHTKSCGCYNTEHNRVHGKSHSRLYNIWMHIKHRCYDENDISYKNYGNRGIAMCNEWKNDFIKFYNWAIQHGYKDNLTIDRKDVNGNYEPSNCRWATKREQDKNKRTTAYTIYNGKKISLLELSETTGIKYNIIAHRHFRGDTNERLTRPIRK